MPYVPMFELLPEIAVKETRTITVPTGNVYGVPPGGYGLVEMYCDDDDCDCRRVLINVISSVTQDSVAVIAFGWESESFYINWFSRGGAVRLPGMSVLARHAVKNMYGIHLNDTSMQSKMAPAILRMVTECALQDTAYVNRLKKHYNLFRSNVNKQTQG